LFVSSRKYWGWNPILFTILDPPKFLLWLINEIDVLFFYFVCLGGENASVEKQPLPGGPAVFPTTVSEYMLPHTQLELGQPMVTVDTRKHLQRSMRLRLAF
jgi:hypothetical protein